MTIQPIGETMRLLITGTRHARAVMPQKDRTLAAATLVGVAVVLAWPRRQPVPQLVRKVRQLGQGVHDRLPSWVDGQ